MDVVETWTGRTASTLQAALRESNETFANRLGVAVRTVASWHANPDLIPRGEMQQALDTVFERSGDGVRRRFVLLQREAEPAAQAQALRVAIAVVTRGTEVLLVCRRDGGALRWQFPAGMVKPGAPAVSVAVQETHAETGVHCSAREHLGSRVHPATGVLADYFVCEHLAGEAENRDVVENVDVAWVPIAAIGRFIQTDTIYPPVLKVLEEAA